MNLCDSVSIKITENSFIVLAKSHSNYEIEERSFETIDKAFAWIKAYWDYEIKELETWE